MQTNAAHPRANAPSASSWFAFSSVISILAVVFAGVASQYARRYALTLRSAAGIYFCFVLLLVFVLVPGMRVGRDLVRGWLRIRYGVIALVGLWCVPYLIYSAGTGDFRWTSLLRLLGIAVPIVAIYRLSPVRDAIPR